MQPVCGLHTLSRRRVAYITLRLKSSAKAVMGKLNVACHLICADVIVLALILLDGCRRVIGLPVASVRLSVHLYLCCLSVL